MTATEREALKKKAMAATPGPWTNHEDVGVTLDVLGMPLLTGGIHCAEEYQANAKYIAAANPQVILALLERIESLEAALNKIIKECPEEYTHDGCTMDSEASEIAREALQGEKGDL